MESMVNISSAWRRVIRCALMLVLTLCLFSGISPRVNAVLAYIDGTTVGNEGDTVTLTSSGKYGTLPYTYEWYAKASGETDYSLVATGSTYTTVLSWDNCGTKIYCKITDKYGNSVKTKAVTLALMSISKHPSGKTVDSTTNVSATVKAKGDGEYEKFMAGVKGAVSVTCTKCNNGSCRNCGGDGDL